MSSCMLGTPFYCAILLHEVPPDVSGVHRFACHLEKGHAPYCVPFELMRTFLRADSNIVHHFACNLGGKNAPFCVPT